MAYRLSERQQRLLAYLAKSNEPLTGRQLAEMLGCSLRTLQGDVAKINRLAPCIRSSNRGYAGDLSLMHKLQAESPDVIPDIAHTVLCTLVIANERHNIADLSEKLYVSIPTLERHLKKINPMLQKANLSLQRSKGVIWIDGNEADKRRLIADLLINEANNPILDTRRASSLFDGMDIGVVHSVVERTISKFSYRIKQGYEDSLLASMSIALYRLRIEATIRTRDSLTNGNSNIEHRIAAEICRSYAEHFPIHPEQLDIDYLSRLLHGQIEPLSGKTNTPISARPDNLYEAVRGIVNDVCRPFGIKIDSEQALSNFANHVDAMLSRSDLGQYPDTGMLDNIKRRLPFVYELSLLIADAISNRFSVQVSPGEIGFICIHVGLLLEQVSSSDCLSIGLISSDYHGIASNMLEELGDRLSEVATVSLASNRQSVAAFDLLITTRALDSLATPSITVSPFLTDDDYQEIERAVTLCKKRRKASQTRRLLTCFLSEELFFKTDSLETKQQVIEFLGTKLNKMGITDESFIPSVLAREELSSTCFFNLFAIPHATELNARRTMLAVLLSKKGIIWDEKPIHVVLMIAVRHEDRAKFMEIYDSVVKALWDEALITKAVNCDSLSEFLDQIASF